MIMSTKKAVTMLSFFIVILAAVCVSIYIANSSGNHRVAVKQASITPDFITSTIISDLKYTDITKIQEDQLIKHYNIPSGLIKDFSLYMSKSANQSFEIACFELADQNGFGELKQIIAEHVTAKAEGFKEQSPAEYEKIQKYTLKQKNEFVFLIISADADAAAKIFLSLVG